MQNILTLETKKYAIKLENFEGPLDLLCHLVDKNKMDIYQVNISQIADQYIEYIQEMEESNLDITSEFLIMASTLLYIKSRGLLPQEVDDEAEITEEELIRRIIEYKKYKKISRILRENFEIFSKRYYRLPEKIDLPKQELETEFTQDMIVEKYRQVVWKNEVRKNQNAKNIERLVLHEAVTITSKVRDILKELVKKPKFVFHKLFSLNQCSKEEVVTAFTSVLELDKRNKIVAKQEEIFGDITIERAQKGKKE